MTPRETQLVPDMQSAKALLDGVCEILKGDQDFRQNWIASAHFFPSPPQAAQSITMHISRPHWLNEEGQGIHFEAQFGPKQWAALEIPLMLHCFHNGTIPGTKIKRIAMTKPFVDSTYQLIASWPGYSFRVGRYGAQSFSCTLSFADDNSQISQKALQKLFQTRLSSEVLRLCQTLGPSIDKALADALK